MKGINIIRRIGLVAGPILFLLVLQVESVALSPMAWKVLGIASWMVVWWLTEAIPIPATALLPLVLFPSLGVLDLSTSASNYANNIIFLFMGGFIIAIALEKHNLHKRIALNLIRLTGTNANGIILGFMLATYTLSMWISNTATAVMMLPIGISVVEILLKQVKKVGGDQKRFKLFALALFLSIAYAANIGGTGTIIGTPPNVVFVGYMKEFFDFELDFGKWLLIGIPISLSLLFATYLMLTRFLFNSRLGKIEGASDLILEHIRNLGKFSKGETLVSIVFLLTALCWIFKNPINNLIGTPLLNDTITAMSGASLMFIIPLDWKKGENVLAWDDMMKLPWGILILFGGGICLARGMETTGLIQFIGNTISGHPAITGWLLILTLTTVMLFMTELMSNVALATIFIPVVFGISMGAGIHPLLVSIPVTLSASCAFMMPISTPPNAIVFASGFIRMKDMVRAGLILNIISVIILFLYSITLVDYVYGDTVLELVK